MTEPTFMDSPHGRRIAFHRIDGGGPGIVFLGGFRSDMEGTKALHLEEWAKGRGRAFLRFDYSGHGQSGGRFEDGAIGDWAEDAEAALSLTEGPQVLVGSSMGGWIALLMAKRLPERIKGLVLIAAAPDFTEDSYWNEWSDVMKAKLKREGRVGVPSDYGDAYMVTKRMIEDGRTHLVLRDPLELPFPVRLLQGTADTAVKEETALRLLHHARCPDLALTLVRDADHRFSDPANLDLITAAIDAVS